MKVSFRIGGRPSAELASKTPEEALRNNLQLAKWELDNAYAGFEYATDPDLIDCWTDLGTLNFSLSCFSV